MIKILRNGVIVVSVLYCLMMGTGMGETAPLAPEGKINLRNCSDAELTVIFSRSDHSLAVSVPLKSKQNSLLKYCPPRCLLSIVTPGRGPFEIDVKSTNRYEVDIEADNRGRYWHIKPEVSGKHCGR